MMDNNKKVEILKDFDPLIKKLAYSYKIYGFTKEELIQELRTHLCAKLDNFNSTKASLPYFVELVLKNKCNNLYNSPYNKKEVLKPKIYLENDEDYYGVAERVALEVAFDLLRKEEHKDMIFEVLKGRTFRSVGEMFNVSYQTVHNVYSTFLKKVKDEV